jgi:putative sterol carrier protein
MSSTLEAKLKDIAKEGAQSELRGTSGTCRFDVDGRESLWIRVENATVTLLDTPVDADCTLSSSSDDWDRIATGEQNPMTTWLRGDLKVGGDVQLANKVGHLFL